MATYTLTGNLQDAVGVALPDATTRAYLIPVARATVEGTGIRITSKKLTVIAGAFSQANIAGGYYYVRAYYEDPESTKQKEWVSPRLGIGSSGDLKDFIVASTWTATVPVVLTVNHVAPDVDGNVDVAGGGGSGTAIGTTFTPAGNISATNVQAALVELDGEKAPIASPTFTGTVSGVTKSMVGLGNVPNVDATNASNITSGTLPTAVLPPLAINETFVVASQAAMLALTAQRGDMAIRTDTGKTMVLSTDSPTTLADWKEVLAAGQVQSVAGKTGVVTLAKADIADLGTIGTAAATNTGTGAANTILGNDARLTDSRTPSAHAASHALAGSDAVSLAASQITSGVLAIGRLATGTPDGTKFVRDDGTLATPAGGGSGSTAWYGDGSDGTVVISSNTTLTRDTYYDNLTVNAGVELRTFGYRVFVKTLLTLDGKIHHEGYGNSFNAGATAAAETGTIKGGGSAGATGVTGAGVASSAVSDSLGGQGGTGGAGTSGAGAAGGAITVPSGNKGGVDLPRTPLGAYVMTYISIGGSWGFGVVGGSGGGSGAGDGTNAGATGGGGGGLCVVFAKAVTGSGTVSANGGFAKSASAGNCGGGGGGGGGAAVLITGSTSHSLSVTANGGAGGAKTGTGVAGSTGSAGRTYQLLGV